MIRMETVTQPKWVENISILKCKPATEFTKKKLIISERVGYLFCQESELEKITFLPDVLLDLFTTFGGLTRDQLAKYTNLPRTTIFDALMKLVQKDKISLDYLKNGKIGRPKTVFKAL